MKIEKDHLVGLGVLIAILLVFASFGLFLSYTEIPASGGSASASSIGDAGETADKAFDGNDNTIWRSGPSSNQASPQWVQYDFGAGNEITPTKITIYTSQYGDNVFKMTECEILGSNTGSFSGEETVLVAMMYNENSNNTLFEYEFSNTVAFRYIRFISYGYNRPETTSIQGYHWIGEMRFYEGAAPTPTPTPVPDGGGGGGGGAPAPAPAPPAEVESEYQEAQPSITTQVSEITAGEIEILGIQITNRILIGLLLIIILIIGYASKRYKD